MMVKKTTLYYDFMLFYFILGFVINWIVLFVPFAFFLYPGIGGTLFKLSCWILMAFAMIWAILWEHCSAGTRNRITTIGLLLFSEHSLFIFFALFYLILYCPYSFSPFSDPFSLLFLFVFSVPILGGLVTTLLFWHHYWKENVVRSRPDPETLYERLSHAYDRIYGEGKLVLDKKIESHIKKGLSREEAVYKMAEEDSIMKTIAILQIVAGIVTVTVGLLIVYSWFWMFEWICRWSGSPHDLLYYTSSRIPETIFLVTGGIKLFIGIVEFVLAYGSLKREGWAWTLGLKFAILGIMADLNPMGWTWLIIDILTNVPIIYLLTRQPVKNFFKEAHIAPTSQELRKTLRNIAAC